eukprot:2229298-Pleurochrysis_carterae.AAC.1
MALMESGEWVVDEEAEAASRDVEVVEKAKVDCSDDGKEQRKGKKGKTVVEDSSSSDEGGPTMR